VRPGHAAFHTHAQAGNPVPDRDPSLTYAAAGIADGDRQSNQHVTYPDGNVDCSYGDTSGHACTHTAGNTVVPD